jgi:hypothetical protein
MQGLQLENSASAVRSLHCEPSGDCSSWKLARRLALCSSKQPIHLVDWLAVLHIQPVS